MWQRSDGGERVRGWHSGKDSVVLWEIREAFMGEMALDLNFAGHGISQVEEEGRKRHGMYPSLVSPLSLLTPFFYVNRAGMCT